MTAVRHMALWPQLRVPRIALLLVTLGACLIRAPDQPALRIGFGTTNASIVPADLLLVVLLVVVGLDISRSGLARSAKPAMLAALCFCALIVVTGAANGAAAFVSAAKLAELAALGLGVAVLIESRAQLEAVVDVVLLFTLVADGDGLWHFLHSGGRQASFLGEHDFAALAALPLLYGIALLYQGGHDRRAWSSITAGAVGCVLGAALASLLGFYFGVAALAIAAALGRRLKPSRLAATVAVVGIVTAGTTVIRAGDLGFLQSWFGKPAERPGQYAASWSQRLVYAYIGGRIFIDHPLLGTGWYGNLPPKEFVAYVPAAMGRFRDQPSNYFPSPAKPFVPQQTYDEILYELGIVGGATFLALLVAAARNAIRTAQRRAAPVFDLPIAWLAAGFGAIAGEGLFGGTALAATFWLVMGVALALDR